MNRTEIINTIIRSRSYSSYLEIGVMDAERNFRHVCCTNKVAVDPAPEVLTSVHHVCTSDEFFSANQTKFDVIFIDGLHLECQVDVDIENAFQALSNRGVIVIHDALPPSEWHQRGVEQYHTGEPWNGTVWKSVLKYFSRSPHLCYVVDCDWGVAIIDTAWPTERQRTALSKELSYTRDFPRLLEYAISPAEFSRLWAAPECVG